MTIADLIKKLEERPKTKDEHREAQLKDWQSAVFALMGQIEDWLRPAVAKGVLKLTSTETKMVEEDFGNYSVPTLHVTDDQVTVRFEPIAGRIDGVVGAGSRRLIGLKGRVDLVCGPIRIPIVRTANDKWMAVPLTGEPRELSADVLGELMAVALLNE